MKMRKEYLYPLVISCGRGKFDIAPANTIEAYKLYDQFGYWNIFRLNSPSLPLRTTPTYVISAKYGLLKHTHKISPYDKVITRKKKADKGQVTISDMIKKLESQRIVKEWKGSKNILFVGGEEYAKALEGAGFKIHRLENLQGFPGIHDRGGVGKQKASLKWFLTDIVPNIRKYKRESLDKLVVKVTPQVMENLSKRFSNEGYFSDMGKEIRREAK